VVAAVALAVVGACAPAPPGTIVTGAPTTTPEQSRPPRPSTATVRPVIIVPGWEFGCEMAPAWKWIPWTSTFEAAGVPADWIQIFDTDRCERNTVLAELLGQWIDALLARTGARQVDLIAHSMGALTARWCIVKGSCAGKVANVVTLSGANHGTVWAEMCAVVFWSKSCPDLAPTSPMLTELNAGDETPDGVRWQTWVSVCEIAIVPQTSALLDGAENHYLTDCVTHDSWKWYRPTIDLVVAELTSGVGSIAAMTPA